jgi:predicted dehydrogenase
MDLIARGSLRVRPLIEKIWSVSEAGQAYASLANPAQRPAVLLSYSTPSQEAPLFPEARIVRLRPAKRPAGEIGVAVVGPGSFMKEVFLPALRKLPGTRLVAVVAGTGGGALSAGDRFGFETASTDLEAALTDPAVHLVLIGTRHHLHAEQVARSLEAGKAVFVEKPLCLTRAEMERVRGAMRSTAPLLAVGFNRRYAPLVREMKERLSLLAGPRVIQVRVNALRLPPDHWTQDLAEGGGRLVGEGCHFVDLIPFLAGAPIASLQVEKVPHFPGSAPSSDNFAISFGMKGGSLGSLLYTSLGDASLAKERIEVHAAGSSLVLDDFRDLWLHVGGSTKRHSRPRDKGIASEVEALVRAVRGEASDLISWAEIEAATEWTLRAREMLEATR